MSPRVISAGQTGCGRDELPLALELISVNCAFPTRKDEHFNVLFLHPHSTTNRICVPLSNSQNHLLIALRYRSGLEKSAICGGTMRQCLGNLCWVHSQAEIQKF